MASNNIRISQKWVSSTMNERSCAASSLARSATALFLVMPARRYISFRQASVVILRRRQRLQIAPAQILTEEHDRWIRHVTPATGSHLRSWGRSWKATAPLRCSRWMPNSFLEVETKSELDDVDDDENYRSRVDVSLDNTRDASNWESPTQLGTVVEGYCTARECR